MNECNVCQNKLKLISTNKVLNKYSVKYFHCLKCGFIQTEKPFWLDEAYQSALNIYDTGVMLRNFTLSEQAESIIKTHFNIYGKFVDYAGGYGIFTRLMRDKGFDFYWTDIYSQNLVARGFEYNNQKSIELVTNFECFEHFVNPLESIETILKISRNLLFSTETYSGEYPPNDWWYWGYIHGQHISFYKLETLVFIAKKYKLNFYTNGVNLHLFTEKKLGILENQLTVPKYSLKQRIGLYIVDFTKRNFIDNNIRLPSKTLTDHYTLIKLHSK